MVKKIKIGLGIALLLYMIGSMAIHSFNTRHIDYPLVDEINDINKGDFSSGEKLKMAQTAIDQLANYPSTIEEHMANAWAVSRTQISLTYYYSRLEALTTEEPDTGEVRSANFKSYIDQLDPCPPASYAEYFAIQTYALQKGEWFQYLNEKVLSCGGINSDAG